jgi:hypothetical protein
VLLEQGKTRVAALEAMAAQERAEHEIVFLLGHMLNMFQRLPF